MAVRRDLMTETLLERAAQLFSEKGLEQTTLQDIAAAMGLSRPALYHYIKSKDDLLERLITEITDAALEDEEVIRSHADLPPVERLREFVRILTLRVTQRPHRFRLFVMAESSMSDEFAQTNVRLKRGMVNLAAEILHEVQATGQARPFDVRVVTMGIIGMTNWLAWWYAPEGELKGEEIAEQFAEMIINGLVVEDGSPNGGGISGALARLRQDVRQLEQLIGQ